MGAIFPREPKKVVKVSTQYRRIVTDLPVPESLPILEQIERYEPLAMQGQPPLIWDRAEGSQVYDPYGNKWLDWSSGVLVANVGHAPSVIRQAAIQQIEKGNLFSYCFASKARAELAEKIVELTPKKLDKVFFLTTGSEATENAIKLARTYGQKIAGGEKTIIVSFERGFHGRTLGAQLAGGSPAAKNWIGESDKNFIQVPFPDGFRETRVDFSSFEEALNAQNIKFENVACVMLESYQGGGASFAPIDYIQKLRKWCDKYQALLVFDEVQAGFARTGKMFAYEHYQVEPDIICLGKAISGGLPLAAVVASHEILDLYGPGSMSSTHGGNPVSCASALANIEFLIKENLIERARAVGEIFFEQLSNIKNEFSDYIGALHGRGMVYGLHIIKRASIEPNSEIAFEIVKNCFERGLLMFAPVGYAEATVKICPPLVITEEALFEGIEVLRSSIKQAIS